jgi:hypothetical protein
MTYIGIEGERRDILEAGDTRSGDQDGSGATGVDEMGARETYDE